ncbi:MAG: hypothetical protein ABMA02_13960 [Saprospiraceae bacterium]
MTTPEEITGLESRRKLLADKANRLREARIFATDENTKFKYDHDIAEAETELADVKAQLSSAYDLGSETGQSQLREKVLDLVLTEPLGRLHLVNCDRHELRDRFEAGFDQRQNHLHAPNHYYMLSSCPTQMPPSLGERMVYELLGDLLDDGKSPCLLPLQLPKPRPRGSRKNAHRLLAGQIEGTVPKIPRRPFRLAHGHRVRAGPGRQTPAQA